METTKQQIEFEAKAMALGVNGGSWDEDYTKDQKEGWRLKAQWAMSRYLGLSDPADVRIMYGDLTGHPTGVLTTTVKEEEKPCDHLFRYSMGSDAAVCVHCGKPLTNNDHYERITTYYLYDYVGMAQIGDLTISGPLSSEVQKWINGLLEVLDTERTVTLEIEGAKYTGVLIRSEKI